LNRFAFALLAVAVLTAHAAKPELGQLDASPTLFTVMAAINAAGYDADLNSPNGHVLRQNIRDELAKRDIPSLPALKEFFQKHRQRNETAELGQYISFALTAGGAPDFSIAIRDVDIPPDVTPLTGLSPLLAAFYKEAEIENLWKRSQRAINQYLEFYHAPVSDAVLQVNAYLRQQTSGFKGRRFQILIELLAAPNQIQTRSYGNEYTIVVTPSPELRTFDIRHGYLHYLLDPLATRNQEILDRKKGIGDHARRAQALADSFKEDFLLLATESLIKAVEAKLDRNPSEVQQALLEGYILAPFFAEQLPVYEKQEASMALFYPDMVKAIDLLKEDARLSKVQFNKEAAVKVVRTAPPPAPPELTGVAKTLSEAETLYRERNLDRAKTLFLEALQQTDQKPLHAAAYYGMARVAALQRDPETADRLFRKVLELDPEPPVKAWTLVYLGKLSLAASERDEAVKFFQDALKVEGASEEARKEAQQGLQTSSKQ
jgi:tetratricopeptide (TPR) repeat protein